MKMTVNRKKKELIARTYSPYPDHQKVLDSLELDMAPKTCYLTFENSYLYEGVHTVVAKKNPWNGNNIFTTIAVSCLLAMTV